MNSDEGRSDGPQEITQLLSAHRAGDPRALKRLLPPVYPELKRVARGQLAKGKPGATWNTTAVVHEAYFKLVDQTSAQWQDRRHFFAVAAPAMRQLLVDEARKKATRKRGGGAGKCRSTGFRRRSIDQALTRLEEANARLCRAFECRYFAASPSRKPLTLWRSRCAQGNATG